MATETLPETRTDERTQTERPWLWNVVLLDDDEHSYEYVIRMMGTVFAYPTQKGFQIANRVDSDGRAVCFTGHKELAELKREQMLSCGRDRLMAVSKGPMSVVLEPAEFGDEDEDEGQGEGRGKG